MKWGILGHLWGVGVVEVQNGLRNAVVVAVVAERVVAEAAPVLWAACTCG